MAASLLLWLLSPSMSLSAEGTQLTPQSRVQAFHFTTQSCHHGGVYPLTQPSNHSSRMQETLFHFLPLLKETRAPTPCSLEPNSSSRMLLLAGTGERGDSPPSSQAHIAPQKHARGPLGQRQCPRALAGEGQFPAADPAPRTMSCTCFTESYRAGLWEDFISKMCNS